MRAQVPFLEEMISLLKQLIATPSMSLAEDKTADLLEKTLKDFGVESVERIKNNVLAKNRYFDEKKPTILLNSHHDTVKANKGYTRNPYAADVEGDILYGLGSNDAGGSLVSLLGTFMHFYGKESLSHNLLFCASAEEETSGKTGIALAKKSFPPIAFGIIGEPTQTDLAIAEKGLIVIDGTAKGKAGHAAREEGINAIYIALKDIEWIKNYEFVQVSPTLGKVKMSVTQIEAGYQHNVVPDECKFVIDVRTTDAYINKKTFEILQANTQSTLKARSLRLNPSSIPITHPIVLAGQKLGKKAYGSATLSDQSLLDIPSLKCGPGDSARSHTPDEYIKLSEIAEGIETYIGLLDNLPIQAS